MTVIRFEARLHRQGFSHLLHAPARSKQYGLC